jgi:hypothetical protein
MASVLVITGSPELLGPLALLAVDRLGQTGALGFLLGILAVWTVGAYAVGYLRFVERMGP